MAIDATKWKVNTNKSIEYIGGDHGTATANYISVLELHRWLMDIADDASVLDHGGDDFMDITTINPSDKSFETIINLINGYYLLETGGTPAVEFVYGGSIIQNPGTGEQFYDGVRVVSTRGVKVNVLQDEAFLTNDFWNNVPSTEKTAATATVTGVNSTGQKVVNVSATTEFAAGDVLLFDELMLHRTACAEGMTHERYAIESWFFAPAFGYGTQVPLLYCHRVSRLQTSDGIRLASTSKSFCWCFQASTATATTWSRSPPA